MTILLGFDYHGYGFFKLPFGGRERPSQAPLYVLINSYVHPW